MALGRASVPAGTAERAARGRRGRRGAADRRRSNARHELLPVRQSGSFTLGGRWVEAEGFRLAQRGDPAQFIAFTADFPFYALAPSWSGEGDPGGSVELLWSADGVTWSEPIWIGRASHSGRPDRDGRIIGSLVSTPGASFSSTGPTTAPATSRRCPGSRSTTSTPPRVRRWSRWPTRPLTPVFAPPPVITRAAWGADESLRFGRGRRGDLPGRVSTGRARDHPPRRHRQLQRPGAGDALDLLLPRRHPRLGRHRLQLPRRFHGQRLRGPRRRRDRGRLPRRGLQRRELRHLPDGPLLRGPHHPGDAQRHRLDLLLGGARISTRPAPRPSTTSAICRRSAATATSTTPPAPATSSTSSSTPSAPKRGG